MLEQTVTKTETRFFFHSFVSFAESNRKDSIETVKEIHKKLEEVEDCKDLFEVLLYFYEVKSIYLSKHDKGEWDRLENLIIIYLNTSLMLVNSTLDNIPESFQYILKRYKKNKEEFPEPVKRVIMRKKYEINLYKRLSI